MVLIKTDEKNFVFFVILNKTVLISEQHNLTHLLTFPCLVFLHKPPLCKVFFFKFFKKFFVLVVFIKLLILGQIEVILPVPDFI